MPGETRWAECRAAIRSHVIGHAFDHRRPDIDYWAFFGTVKARDVRHAELFREHGGETLNLRLVEGAAHNLSRLMKRARVLSPLIALLMREGRVEPAEVDRLLLGAGLRIEGMEPDQDLVDPGAALGWRDRIRMERQTERVQRRAERAAAREELRRARAR